MTTTAILQKWQARVRDSAYLPSNYQVLFREILDDLVEIASGSQNELLNLREAARQSGYSADHLGRKLKSGEIPNAGRPGAPRIRLRDLPRKATRLRADSHDATFSGTTPV